MIGSRIGPYEVVARIGEGGMGEVYRARDARLNRDVALKVLPASFAQDPDRLRRFTLEAQTAGALNHTNVLTIYEIGHHAGRPFIVSELLEGETIREKLAAGPLPVSKAVDYARQVAAGLAAAHARQIIHRDIKPENLFVTTDGRVKILDFGLARQAAVTAGAPDGTHLETRTSPGMVLGTIGYMSPEQVRAGQVDHRSDLFSLGIVLYEMLAGARPFTGDSAVETMNAILTADPPDLTASGRMVPPALMSVVRHALEKAPDERFQSARDMAFALQAATTSSGTTTTAAVDVARRRSLWPAAVVVTWVAGAVVGGLAMWLARPPAEAGVDVQGRRFTPVAMDGGIETQPVWSPDGRSLAYFASPPRPTPPSGGSGSDVLNLVVKELDGVAPVTLATKLQGPLCVFWWPDSTRVGYVDRTGIWSVSRIGGEPERLQEGDFDAAALSPDGRTLAAWKVTTEGTTQTPALWIASPPNAAPVRYERAFVGGVPYSPVYLQFAPDGERLLLSGYLPDTADAASQIPAVWEIRGTTAGNMSAPRKLFASRAWETPPEIAWFPDGQRVALAVGNAPGLWIGDLRSDSLSKLTDGLAGERWPSVSPDGRRIAFETRRDDFDLVRIPLDGSPIVDVIAASADETAGAASADGRIVYASTRSGSHEIRLREPGGFDRAIVTARDFPGEDVGHLSAPVFSPDGQRVAFQRLSRDAIRSWITPVAGGGTVRIAPPEAPSIMPDWSPDGRFIAYATTQAGTARILKQRVGSSDPPVVLADGFASVYAHLLAWSPDGHWIAHDSPDGLSLVAAEGGTRRLLVPRTRPRAIAWSLDSRTIYALIIERGVPKRIVAVDVRSGSVKDVRTLPDDLEFVANPTPGLRMTLTPDGAHLLTTALRQRADILLMEGF